MKTTKSILVDHELWEKFRMQCLKNKLIMGDIIADLIEEYLRKVKK